ncbi:hypothetical protein BG844_18550 [Couchioplanes caeruleus subsp. caeruleus]|uniref:Uncharacterized protein n=1 Tax=Couchioplanes caeruleus subsp. caeruleus TaxID=56427 RepID=A0A1K0FJB6_9ACTN|nr:hypothetical protein [Couchioplanes caeruleus]OJF12816.1 hypothetical protein BG844_18550 [Couchioplanes caeruleus subsp. caeruleus]
MPPYVSLRGAGITQTVLRMDPSTPSNRQYSTIIRHNDVDAPGSTQIASDLTVNGNCRTGAGAPIPTDMPGRPGEDCDFRSIPGATTNTGGGVAVGDGWTVRQVRITNVPRHGPAPAAIGDAPGPASDRKTPVTHREGGASTNAVLIGGTPLGCRPAHHFHRLVHGRCGGGPRDRLPGAVAQDPAVEADHRYLGALGQRDLHQSAPTTADAEQSVAATDQKAVGEFTDPGGYGHGEWKLDR